MPGSLNPATEEWDVIVVGGGAVGENAAQYATEFTGLSAVIVEEALMGGECSYWACMPSKALLRPVDLAEQAGKVPGLTALAAGRLDVDAVLARRDKVVSGLDDSSQVDWALNTGIDVIRGRGRLAGERRVEVTLTGGGTRTIQARHAVVLDTGSTARLLPVDGLAAALPWTSKDVTNLHVVPRRVAVIGGGVVACEAATWLHGLGVAELTIIARDDRLLAGNEPFAGEIVGNRLSEAGVRLQLSTGIESVSRVDPQDTGYGNVHGGEVTLTLDDGQTLVVDELVVASGRQPASVDIGLETVGLDVDGGFVPVDDHLTVEGVPGEWLYAVGDLCGRALLTHMGKYQARVAGSVISARAAGQPLDDGEHSPHVDQVGRLAVPGVTFTVPEIGSVGLTESRARDEGYDVHAYAYDLASLAGTYVLGDDYVGRASIVVDDATDRLLGATFVGSGVAELTHSATVAVVGRLPLRALWHVVPSYPTISEVWLRLLEAVNTERTGGLAGAVRADG